MQNITNGTLFMNKQRNSSLCGTGQSLMTRGVHFLKKAKSVSNIRDSAEIQAPLKLKVLFIFKKIIYFKFKLNIFPILKLMCSFKTVTDSIAENFWYFPQTNSQNERFLALPYPVVERMLRSCHPTVIAAVRLW